MNNKTKQRPKISVLSRLVYNPVSLLIPGRSGETFVVYSSYAGPRYYGFEQNLRNSVKLRSFSGFTHIVALSNSIKCNIQPT